MIPGTLNTGYTLNYSYDPVCGRRFRLSEVAETSYRTEGTPTDDDNILSTHSYGYDPNGNLSSESVARKRYDNSSTQLISERKLSWDGLNRLRGISENGYVSLYWYDADGNRTVKEHLGGEAVWVNGAPAGVNTDTLTYTIYPNPYITINGNRWTKHYYIGSERIASQTGTISAFGDLNIPDSHAAGASLGISISYGGKKQMEEDSIASMYSQLGVPYEVQRTRSGDAGCFLYLPACQGGGDAASGDAGNDRQRSHPNTLQRFKYNGKELDLMHGLKWYDYGARMYDPILLTWNSIDPLCEKYYNVSPYAYCHNNPVLLVDLNGTDDYFDENGEFIKRTETGSNVLVMIDGQFVNITEVDFSGKYSIIENIGRYYLSKSDKYAFTLTVSSTGGDISQDVVFSNIAGTQKYDIYLTNGYVNPILGNCYDFECITFHESTHRYYSSTHGGTIGEAYAIILTANKCPAWRKASDGYIISQAAYAEQSLNLYAKEKLITVNIVKKLNKAFAGYASFGLKNNKISKTNLLEGLTIWGINRQKK